MCVLREFHQKKGIHIYAANNKHFASESMRVIPGSADCSKCFAIFDIDVEQHWTQAASLSHPWILEIEGHVLAADPAAHLLLVYMDSMMS